MPTGQLDVYLRTAKSALPISKGSIAVENERGDTVFYEFLTAASSGVSREIMLEAPPKALSLENDSALLPYARYSVFIRAEGNYRMRIEGIQIFEGAHASLPVELIPLPEGTASGDDADIIVITIPEHILRQGGPSSGPPPESESTVAAGAIPAVNIGAGVFIPETVTVHLGAPDEDAPDVTVAFTDYIKNVASSEIYPTWPDDALRSNILAQISITLNRIYTEWYRSRGYTFDITSSTAYDQAFVAGRNIYDEISTVTDDIFNNYLKRPNSVEPLYATYCNGTTATCAGLSQWGTVALAESGQSYADILGFYYGNIEIVETDDIRTNEESYPGEPLSLGSTGENVRIIQEQLNRIAINFPMIPLIEVSSVFGESTDSSVKEFQRLFVLPPTGIVDRATWYRISQIYSSAKRLSELTSEGQRAVYNQQLYPGYPVGRSSRGSEVQEIQFYLQRISRFNPTVQSPSLDGIFGAGTEAAVRSFQTAYELAQSGTVDEVTWQRLVEVYNGTLDNVDEPTDAIPPIPYPGAVLSQGSTGEYVKYIQQSLNRINNVFIPIPEISEDGIYGSATENAVGIFSTIFGLPRDGTVDAVKWNKITQITDVVQRNCIFSSGEFDGAREFPKVLISIGSEGENVRYIQSRINEIYKALPIIGSLTVDGMYGAKTAGSISALQRVFGLGETGRADESTWLLINYITSAIRSGCLPTALPQTATVFSEAELGILSESTAIKELLRQNGISVGSGPIFGMKSRRALMRWQSENGLLPTGLPNGETVERLIKK